MREDYVEHVFEEKLLEHMKTYRPEGDLVDLPGTWFSPERTQLLWIEPRLLTIVRPSDSRKGNVRWSVSLQVRCFVKTGSSALARGTLSKLVDHVRALVDPEMLAPAMRIYDYVNNNPATLGLLQFLAVGTSREYATSATIADEPIYGIDVATLSISATVTSGACG